MSHKQFGCSPVLFSVSPQAKIDFFWPNRCDCNNIAHGIFSCHKLQDLFSQSIDKIWRLYMKSYSYQRDHRIPSLRARKAYQQKVYSPICSLIASSFHLPKQTNVKTTQINVFPSMRQYQTPQQNSENQPRHLFDRLNFFYLSCT